MGVLSGLQAPGSPGPDPTGQHRHLAALQRSGRRHLQLARSAQRLNQEASARFPGNDGRAAPAPQQRRPARLQRKPAHSGLVVVTAQAMPGEQRPHLLLEEPHFLQARLSGCELGRRQTQHERRHPKQHRSGWLVQSICLNDAWGAAAGHQGPTLPCRSFEEKLPIVKKDEPRMNTNRVLLGGPSSSFV